MLFPSTSYAETKNPVLVELFTSQGCSSCPPADKFLGKLINDKNIVALAFHVDYWDQLGWKDPFSLKASTGRQRDYSRRVGRMYTPQMIINGKVAMPGTSEEEVLEEIEKENNFVNPVKVNISEKDDKLIIDLVPKEGMRQKNVDVWLVRFKPYAETKIGNGENDGRTIENHNIVRKIDLLAIWDSEPRMFEVEKGKNAVAVIVQEDNLGRVLGTGIYQP